MNHYLLCFHFQTDASAELPWKEPLEQRHCSLLRTPQLHEAKAYCRAYPLVMALVRFSEPSPDLVDAVRQLSEAIPQNKRLPLVGLHERALGSIERAELCEAGLCDFIAADDPERLVIWQLDILSRLAELDQFAQAHMDVGELARRTRELLHDLSQPLSAVQGRLQLMAARAQADDPNAAYYQEMVRLMSQATRQMAEIQQLHRAYS